MGWFSSLRQAFGGAVDPESAPEPVFPPIDHARIRLIVGHAQPLFHRGGPPVTENERKYREIQREGEERLVQHIVTHVMKAPRR